MLQVYSEMPSVIYPIGAILEDEKMIMKVLEFKEVRTAHSYKVEVLQWKVMPPELIQRHMDMKTTWILITPYSIPKITVHK
jgi:hypothetical protein